MKSNRKSYEGTGIAHEFTTREQASDFAKQQGATNSRIERRYAPQSPNRAEDGYVCVVRIQSIPFGPINAQREYLDSVPLDVLRAAVNRRTAAATPKPKVLVPCVGCQAPLSARERRKPCPHCGARNPR